MPTRRAIALNGNTDFKAYQLGKILPVDLLQDALVQKVRHLFLRGDYDTAVFQAFHEVEVAVREASGLGDELYGAGLMRRAFDTKDGPLRDKDVIPGEREAELHLFSGAIGHAKNPVSHRRVGMGPIEAARLIVLASHLLEIVEERGSRSRVSSRE
jgi:uncharacterized protein (TIGR02391 family)